MFALFACAEPVDSAYVPEEAVELAEAALPDPSWTAEEVGQQINSALAMGLPDPSTVLAAYQAMWAGADASCPRTGGEWNMTEIVSSCHAESGWTYAGVTGYEPGEGDDFWLMGDGYIQDAEGVTFTLAGELERETTEEGWETQMTGTWSYPAADTPWLAELTGLALWSSLAVGGLRLEGGYGVAGIDLNFESVAVPPGCATGTVWLRDPGGSWYTLALAESCESCGVVEYGGVSLGEACLNLGEAAKDLGSRME